MLPIGARKTIKHAYYYWLRRIGANTQDHNTSMPIFAEIEPTYITQRENVKSDLRITWKDANITITDSDTARVSQQETYTSLQPSDYIDETTGKEMQYILKKSEYTYSNTNQLLKLVERMYVESNKDIARKSTKYTYDNNGNQLKQSIRHILPDNTALRPKTTGAAYGDKLSDNTDKIDKLLEKTSYTYDSFNRLKKTETIKDGIRTTVDFTYNGDDLRVSKTTRKSRACIHQR